MAMLALFAAAVLAATPLTVIDATSSAALDTRNHAQLPEPPSIEQLVRAQSEPETLQGFDAVLLTQINALFGSENLPLATGGPIEPGMYVSISSSEVLVFDEKIIDLQAGVVPPGPASRECKSGCKTALWSPLRSIWLRALEEAQTYVLEPPIRVMFAAEASVPAKTVLELAYALAETRPSGPPNFTLLVNGANTGLRARPFFVLPPGGLRLAPGDNALGLRVTLGAGESFKISAAHPRFAPVIQGTGWKDLAAQLVGVAKRFPNKSTIIIDVGDDASVGDMVMAMVAAQQNFPTVVLTQGGVVRWG